MRASTEEGNQGRTAPLLRGGSTSAPSRWPPITATISPRTPAGNREAVTTHHIRRAAPPLNVAGIYRNLSSSTSVAAHLKRSCNHPKLYDGLHTRYRPSQRRRTTCTTTTPSRRAKEPERHLRPGAGGVPLLLSPRHLRGKRWPRQPNDTGPYSASWSSASRPATRLLLGSGA